MIECTSNTTLTGASLICIASGVWLVAIWNLLAQINFYYPGLPGQLMVGFAAMALAIIIALFALVRSTLVLKAVYAASPKQEPVPQVQERG